MEDLGYLEIETPVLQVLLNGYRIFLSLVFGSFKDNDRFTLFLLCCLHSSTWRVCISSKVFLCDSSSLLWSCYNVGLCALHCKKSSKD